jgi:hypothetical protein
VRSVRHRFAHDHRAMSVRSGHWHGLSMLITMDRSGGYEDLLRSLGALLDERGARTVIVRDIPAGLLVRAVMPSGRGGGPGRELAPIDQLFASPTLVEAQVAALLRRGTDHQAGSIEQALRAVGREIDTQALGDAESKPGAGEDRWSVWHHRITDGHVEVICLTTEDLEGFGLAGRLEGQEGAERS